MIEVNQNARDAIAVAGEIMADAKRLLNLNKDMLAYIKHMGLQDEMEEYINQLENTHD